MNSDRTSGSSRKKYGLWLTFALVVCGLQLLSSLFVSVMLIRVNMLPAVYLAAAILVFLLLWLLVFWLLYLTDKRRSVRNDPAEYSGRYIRRTIGTLIAVVVILVCLIASTALDKMIAALNAVTEIGNVETEIVNVYVLDEDPAQNLTDARDYTFGVTTQFDYDNSLMAVDHIQKAVEQDISVKEYDSVFDMIDALYSGEVGALILNAAYVGIISDVDDYSTFEVDTRVLEDVEIQVIPDTTAENSEQGSQTAEETRRDSNAFIVYISGSDTRSKTLTRGNSDVNILVVVNPDTHQILLVNTPRDYYIHTSVSGDDKDKLTHCGVYGTHCSMDTLGMLYSVDVDYYAQINFTGFETLVNAIGGVEVYSDASFTAGSYSFKEGYNTVDGAAALAFARERHALSDGDHARGRHQMALITAIIKKMTGSTALISNYSEIMDSLSGMFTTDITTDMISGLVKAQIADNPEWTIHSYAVTGSNSSARTYSLKSMVTYVMEPDLSTVAKATSLMQKVLQGGEVTDEDVQ